MKRLDDLVTHPFTDKKRTNNPNIIRFNSPLLGEGQLGCVGVSKSISLLYINTRVSDDFIWLKNQEWYDRESIFLNYFIAPPKSLQIQPEAGKGESRFLAIDTTAPNEGGLLLKKDELFELFQLSISPDLYRMYKRTHLKNFSKETKERVEKDYLRLLEGQHLLPIGNQEEYCIREIINCAYSGKLFNQFTELKVSELMIYLFQRLANDGFIEEENALSDTDRAIMAKVKSILDTDFNKSFNLEKFALEYAMNPKRLEQLFTDIHGMSISKYSGKVRMEKARSLLESDEMSITGIAYQLGFSSVPSFSRAFYTTYNIRPSEYRKSK